MKISEATLKYILDVVHKTREHREIHLPASPRGSLSLLKVSQAWTFIMGEDFVRPGTVYKMIPYVLAHRLALTNEARFQGRTKDEVIKDILDSVKVPTR